jgi:hypothetical protein
MKRLSQDQCGYAIIMALVVTAITAALVLGFISQVNTEQKIASNDTDYSSAFYAAEAGLEKLNSDLSKLFAARIYPTQADIATIMADTHKPNLPGINFRQYSAFGGQTTKLDGAVNATATAITVDSTADWPTSGFFMIDSEEFTYTGITSTSFTGVARGQTGSTAAAHNDNAGVTRSRVATLSEGDYSGLTAQMIPFNLEVTAQSGVGTEAKLMREVQAALIPVFQFGMFSDSDLSFFAGPNFTFNGRIHTNGNLFLTQFAGTTLTLTDKVTAFQEVVRSLMPNGYSGLTGTVMLKSGTSTSRALGSSEQSYIPGALPPPPPPTGRWSGWTNLSLTTYNGYLKNGLTGARNLKLPFVADGYANVELIRRPPAGEGVDTLMGESRLANQASLRVFISDTEAQLPGGTGYLLRNGLAGYTGTPFAEANPNDPDFITSAAGNAAGTLVVDETSNAPLIDGYILIERQDSDGSWNDVTMEILNLGVSQSDTNAILRFQKPRWDATGTTAADFAPINLFDTQQGRFRNGADSLSTTTRMRKLGIMNVVELNVGKLREWFAGTIGATGAMALSNNGYIFYFSDRRGNRDGSGNETGELGFEDTVNPASTNGDPNSSLDPGEDLNGNGTLDTYGANLPYSPYSASTDLYTTGVHASPPQKSFFLREDLDTTETSFDVASTNGLTVGYYRLDNEIVNCTSVGSNPITCSRGQLGTTAATHVANILASNPFARAISLTEDLDTTETGFDVSSVQGLSVGHYRIDNEIVNCTSVSTSPITCSRGQLGTTAATHVPTQAIDLVADVTSTTATAFTVSSDTNVTTPGYYRINSETVLCTSKSASVLTCQRGLLGTTATTHTAVRNWVNTSVAAGTTSITVVSGAAFPAAASYYRIDNETVRCTRATNTLTCTRGQLGTAAVAHNSPWVSVNPSATSNATQTTFNFATTAAFANPPGILRIDSEVVNCTGKTGTQLTGCARGQEGTTATTHGTTAPMQTRLEIRLVNVLPVNVLASERAAKNRVHYFRRSLRLVNGASNNLPQPGFTAVSENTIYVLGNYNADGTANFADAHSHAAVIGDVVTLLSNLWMNGGDERSFMVPHDTQQRPAVTTWHRMAIASGKGINFARPTAYTEPDIYYGTDGGAHNFLRYLEDWLNPAQTSNYRGSIVSLYYMMQAVGPFKCCGAVYHPPTRAYGFDIEFLVPSQLPPGTPRFRDINNLSFRQTIRAD